MSRFFTLTSPNQGSTKSVHLAIVDYVQFSDAAHSYSVLYLPIANAWWLNIFRDFVTYLLTEY